MCGAGSVPFVEREGRNSAIACEGGVVIEEHDHEIIAVPHHRLEVAKTVGDAIAICVTPTARIGLEH